MLGKKKTDPPARVLMKGTDRQGELKEPFLGPRYIGARGRGRDGGSEKNEGRGEPL